MNYYNLIKGDIGKTKFCFIWITFVYFSDFNMNKLDSTKFPYIERDISWLEFNYRVLQEARDPSNPLWSV